MTDQMDIPFDYGAPVFYPQNSNQHYYPEEFQKQMDVPHQQYFPQDFEKPFYYQQNDFKPQYQLEIQTELPPTIPEITEDGPLEDLNYEFPPDFVQYQEMNFNPNNNNNNNNNNGFEPEAKQWKQIEPVNFEIQVEQPIIKKSQRELKKDQNKLHAAKCLKKKKERQKNLEKDSMELLLGNDRIKRDNEEKERHFHYGVQQVLLPILGDNNQIFDHGIEYNEIYRLNEKFEQKKNSIEMNVEINRAEDQLISKTWNAYSEANETFEKAEAELRFSGVIYNKKGKPIPRGTLGSRRCRAMGEKEAAYHEYQISWFKYDRKKYRQLASLIDDDLKFIHPFVKRILLNFRRDLCDAAENDSLPEEQTRSLRYFLFRDAG